MPDPDPNDPPAPNPDPKDDPAPPGDDKTFTQADIDRVVQERLARERSKFGDYDDLKAKAAKLDELEAENQSVLEKAQTRAEQAEQAAKAADERAREALLRSNVVTVATKANAVDPDAVLALLDTKNLELGDDGQFQGLEEAVNGLLEAKPYLVGAAPTPGRPGGSAEGGARGGDAPGRQLSRDDLKTMSPSSIAKADADGLLADLKAGKTT